MKQSEPNSLETILVVEDHPIVLEAVTSTLSRAGFRVLAAASSTEAIRLENETKKPIHLLLSDVMMPDKSGPVIAAILQKRRPDMRVMLMSGYRGGDMLFLNHGWHFIEKPFLAQQLVERINDLLHSPQETQGAARFDTRIMKPKS